MKRQVKFVPNRIHVKTGDNVIVISGKDNGKIGKVTRVYTKTGKVLVESVNLVTRATKASVQNPRGGLIKKEAPIHSCKVMIYDENVKKGVRVSQKVLENGEKVRVSKKSDKQFENKR